MHCAFIRYRHSLSGKKASAYFVLLKLHVLIFLTIVKPLHFKFADLVLSSLINIQNHHGDAFPLLSLSKNRYYTADFYHYYLEH